MFLGLIVAIGAVFLVLAMKLTSHGGGPGGGGGQGGSVATAGASAIGGPFTLIDQTGRRVDQRLLLGKWSVVYFGYTYCPDVCPATLQALGAATRRLGARAAGVQTLFITVDPARDTPAQMKLYLQSQGFPAHAVGLTGSPAEIAGAAKAYGVYYAVSGGGADYSVDHSSALYLMNPKGRFDRPLSATMTPKDMAQQIGEAMDGR